MVHESGRIIQYHLQLKNEFYMISKIIKNFMLNILFQHIPQNESTLFVVIYYFSQSSS